VKTAENRPPAPPSGTSVAMGIPIQSPSYGPGAPFTAATAAIMQVHNKVAPYLLTRTGVPGSVTAPTLAAPPAPYDPALVAQGAAEAEQDLQRQTAPLPGQLFGLSNDFGRQFVQLRASQDYTPEGQRRQLDATFDKLAARAQTLTDGWVKSASLLTRRWVDQERDPGTLLLITPEVLPLVGVCATAPIPFVVALLEQLTPRDPNDPGNRLRRENVAATLRLRRPEWSVNPRLAEEALAALRRVQAKDRTAAFFGGIYVTVRLDRMGRAWAAAIGSLLQHGQLDEALQMPLTLAFDAPADPTALVYEGLPQDDVDVLQAFGLKAADVTGLAPRSSEAGGPIRLTDTGSRAT